MYFAPYWGYKFPLSNSNISIAPYIGPYGGYDLGIKPLEKEVGVERIIATKVNKYTGKFESRNCHDYQKIKRYEAEMRRKNDIKRFYSDSIKSDKAMFEYALEAYLVKKNKIEKIDPNNYK